MTYFRVIIITLLVFATLLVSAWFVRPPSATGVEKWGVVFSHKFARETSFDWQQIYLAILDDLQPEVLRMPIYWDEIEKERDTFDFTPYDFMLNEAEKRNIAVTVVMGERVPRWPECHAPSWTNDLTRKEKQREVADLLIAIIDRYKHRDVVKNWQVENEPFLPYFGECPFTDIESLDKELTLVRFLDPDRPIVVTDSGELSLWIHAAQRADVFGTTIYRVVWNRLFSWLFGYIEYPLPPKFFWMKANIVHFLYGNDKKIIVSELQLEPWAPEAIFRLPVEEQEKSLDIEQFHKNIEYARAVGFPEVYMWGAEWWYWMKEAKDMPEYWEAAQETIQGE